MEEFYRDIDIVDDSFQSILPYMIKNRPVLVRSNPKAWSTVQRDLIELRNRFGFCAEHICTIVECDDMRLKSKEYTGEGHEIDTADKIKNTYSNQSRASISLKEFFTRVLDNKEDNIYLKDWHIDQIPDLNLKYTVPESFSDDWLNWYCKTCRASDGDDYSFLYMGGARTYTSLHHDVCCSNSWSINIFGHKKWTLWPPSESYKLASNYRTTDRNINECVPLFKRGMEDPLACFDTPNISDPKNTINENKNCSITEERVSVIIDIDIVVNTDGEHIDQHTPSKFHNDIDGNNTHDGNNIVSDARDGCYNEHLYMGVSLSNPIVFVQQVGQAVFVPSGWYHQVENMPDTNRHTDRNGDDKDMIRSAWKNSNFSEKICNSRNLVLDKRMTSQKWEIKDGQQTMQEDGRIMDFDENSAVNDSLSAVGVNSANIKNLSGSKARCTSSIQDLTVSINRNWFNGLSVREVWLFLCRELDAVRQELWYLKPSWNDNDICLSTFTNGCSRSDDCRSDEQNENFDCIQENTNEENRITENYNHNNEHRDKTVTREVDHCPSILGNGTNSTKNIISGNGNITRIKKGEEQYINDESANSKVKDHYKRKFPMSSLTSCFSGTSVSCDELPPMGILEWHKHSEVLLRANAAISFKEFIELIAARVLMMDTCKNILLERGRIKQRKVVVDIPCEKRKTDVNRSSDDKNGDEENYRHREPSRAQDQGESKYDSDINNGTKVNCESEIFRLDSLKDDLFKRKASSISPYTWHRTLCPRYKIEMVTEEDIETHFLLCTTTVSEEDSLISKCNFLSNYITSAKGKENDDSSKDGCYVSLIGDLHKVRKCADSLASRYEAKRSENEHKSCCEVNSALKLTCRQLELVITDMISSTSFLLHLSCSLSSGPCAVATTGESTECDGIQLSPLIPILSSHLNDLKNLLDCISNLCVS